MDKIRNPKQRERGGWLAAPSTLYLVIFFLIPLLLMLMMSLLTRGSNSADYRLPLNLENYQAIFEDPIQNIFLRSLRIAFMTTAICFIMGYPLAFFISTRQKAWVRQFALFLVILPFWTNFLVRTYAWQIILGRRGVLNELIFWIEEQTSLHLLDKPLEILGTETAVLLGLVYSFLPFMVLPIFANVERFNFRLVEAGHDLGANDWQVFWRIIFPNTLPGVVAGWILVFIPSIGAFVTPALLGGTEGYMIGNFINRQFQDSGGSWVLGSGSSMAIMFLVCIALFIYLRYSDENRFASEQRSLIDRILEVPVNIILLPINGFMAGLRMILAGINPPKNTPSASPATYQVSRWEMAFDLWIRRIGKVGLWLNPIVCFTFLWIPIIVLISFSFNDSRRAGGRWEGFTTQWYERIFEGVAGTGGSEFSTEQMLEAVQTSMKVSLISTVIATILGTSVAIALVRSNFFGKGSVDGLLYLPVVIPDITQGVALLVFFKVIYDIIQELTGTRYFSSLYTVIIAHVAFNISYVAIVVRARLADMNPRLEEAARDLGANEWRTFWRITYPLLLPGIIAGALLAFTLSLDDFVITFFVGGGTITTLTVFVWGLVRRGVSPEINAVSTLMVVVSTILIAASLFLQGRNASQNQG